MIQLQVGITREEQKWGNKVISVIDVNDKNSFHSFLFWCLWHNLFGSPLTSGSEYFAVGLQITKIEMWDKMSAEISSLLLQKENKTSLISIRVHVVFVGSDELVM